MEGRYWQQDVKTGMKIVLQNLDGKFEGRMYAIHSIMGRGRPAKSPDLYTLDSCVGVGQKHGCIDFEKQGQGG